MSTHISLESMLKESLREMLEVSEYCVKYRKDPVEWGSSGCFGYPAGILLFAIADSIGKYVIKGSTREHFNILKHTDYYKLDMDDEDVTAIYKKYRNPLTHEASLAPGVVLDIGEENDKIFETKDSVLFINLLPFLVLSKEVVNKFLSRQEVKS